MSEVCKTWYVIVEGEIGETLWPSGLVVIDTKDDLNEAALEARRLSSVNVKHYRVIKLEEVAVYCAPALRTHKGEGKNPMKPEERAKILRETREEMRKQEVKHKPDCPVANKAKVFRNSDTLDCPACQAGI